jgi:hypothetical protein
VTAEKFPVELCVSTNDEKEQEIMAIAGIGSTLNAYQPHVQSNFKQRQQDVQNLASALQSGDLTGAQTAFAALQKLRQGQQTPSGQQGNNATNPIRTDFTALGKALQSGDISGAQSAFATLQKDVQSLQQGQGGQQVGGHHHHHHHGGNTPEATASPVSPSASNGASPSTGTTINVRA